jgi:hypothetical protein
LITTLGSERGKYILNKVLNNDLVNNNIDIDFKTTSSTTDNKVSIKNNLQQGHISIKDQ